MKNRLILILMLTFCPVLSSAAEPIRITPFVTVNQSPLVAIYGLPADSSTEIAGPGSMRLSLANDLSSNYTVSSNSREKVSLDGETYRTTLSVNYGLLPGWEVGIEVPYLIQGGGFLDSFIVDWHKTFSLPQGGRDTAAKDRFGYSYSKDGVQKLRKVHAGSGIGDVTLTAGMLLYEERSEAFSDRLALRAALKLPSGDSSALRGSGGTDFRIQLCGDMTNYTEWGSLGVFGSLGGLVMSDGDVLRNQHNNLAGFGTLGLGWGPASWIAFKVQLNGNTPLYRGSSLDELSGSSLMLVSGGTLRLLGNYLLDIGVSEDVAVATAPDVSFHLELSKKF